MNRTVTLIAGYILLVILLMTNAVAANIQNVTIKDILSEDRTVQEAITIHMTSNTKNTFSFTLPKNAHTISVNSNPVTRNNNSIIVPLNCSACTIQIGYTLNKAIKSDTSYVYTFSRTLNLPKTPQSLEYSVYIPTGYTIGYQDNQIEPPVVPTASEFKTDGNNIIIVWNQKNPQLPQRYFITYYKQEEVGTFLQQLQEELSETIVWGLILTSLILGASLATVITRYRKAPSTRTIQVIPPSLLSPDELAVLKVLKGSNTAMNQKDIAKNLDWSKSKVSAVMTNLQYKDIIKRHKQGRNYRIEVIRNIDE